MGISAELIDFCVNKQGLQIISATVTNGIRVVVKVLWKLIDVLQIKRKPPLTSIFMYFRRSSPIIKTDIQ